jgi:predicted CopG family antitoxin
MTTIQVTNETRDRIREYSGKDSVDKALNRLFDESKIPVFDESIKSKRKSKTNVSISDETFERLKQYKLYARESHSDTILRLLNELSD